MRIYFFQCNILFPFCFSIDFCLLEKLPVLYPSHKHSMVRLGVVNVVEELAWVAGMSRVCVEAEVVEAGLYLSPGRPPRWW